MGAVKLTNTRPTDPQDDGLESCRGPGMLGVGQPSSAELDNTKQAGRCCTAGRLPRLSAFAPSATTLHASRHRQAPPA